MDLSPFAVTFTKEEQFELEQLSEAYEAYQGTASEFMVKDLLQNLRECHPEIDLRRNVIKNKVEELTKAAGLKDKQVSAIIEIVDLLHIRELTLHDLYNIRQKPNEYENNQSSVLKASMLDLVHSPLVKFIFDKLGEGTDPKEIFDKNIYQVDSLVMKFIAVCDFFYTLNSGEDCSKQLPQDALEYMMGPLCQKHFDPRLLVCFYDMLALDEAFLNSIGKEREQYLWDQATAISQEIYMDPQAGKFSSEILEARLKRWTSGTQALTA